MDRIGKYIIHKLSLTTGYAQVVFCHDPDLNVAVAIKLFDPRRIKDSPLSQAQWLSRFVAEARGMAAVEHVYVAPVKVLEQLADGRPYFVMPFFAAHLPFEIGKDPANAEALAALADADKPRRLPFPRAHLLLRQIASALAALHRRGMVHRWVKPSNILLTAREGGAVRLIDFSMVKFPGQNLPIPDVWPDHSPYTAPEQVENAQAVGAQADVYALGALAYRMTTGKIPGPNVADQAPPEGLPTTMWDFIVATTNPDPLKRPLNAGVALPMLEAIPADVPASSQRGPVVTKRRGSKAAAQAG